MWRNFATLAKILKVFRAFLKGSFIMGQNVEPTLGNMLCFGAIFYYCKWPNV